MIIDCGNDLFVGDAEACRTFQRDRTIHVVRPRHVFGATCNFLQGAGTVVEWSEDQSITEAKPDFRMLPGYASLPGRLLVHCQSGHHRGPHIALLAAIGRGMDPFAVMELITRKRFELTTGVPAWQWPDLNHIFRFAADRGGSFRDAPAH